MMNGSFKNMIDSFISLDFDLSKIFSQLIKIGNLYLIQAFQ